jgi:OHCU decarboxylase
VSAGLDRLNALPAEEAEALLVGICASPAWAEAVIAGRPYADGATLKAAARTIWEGLGPDEWRLAFSGHPRIGEHGGAAPEHSTREQAEMASADPTTAAAIARGNQEYEQRFGYVFLIRAAGRTPDEILLQLRQRLGHDLESELEVAAGQQAEITDLRLADVFEP